MPCCGYWGVKGLGNQAMKEEAAKMLAAGFSKREVVKWASERGFVGKQLSDAVGISLRDLQTDNY